MRDTFYIIIFCLLLIRPTFGAYIITKVYSDTLDQCADYLVPIATAIYPPSSNGCVNEDTGGGIQSSYTFSCIIGSQTSYTKNLFTGGGCTTPASPPSINVQFNDSVCVSTNNPAPNIVTNGTFNVFQHCRNAVPTVPDSGLPTLTISEYSTPSCNNGSPDPSTLMATTTSILNQCQNTGGATEPPRSFVIKCNSATAYISYFDNYGCLSTNFNITKTLFQVGCSSNSTSSIVVSCSGTTPQPSNDIWALITQGPYFIYIYSAGAGLVGGAFLVCFCICLCRRRNRNKRYRRSFSSPTQYSTSVQSNGVISDGIGTPLRSDVLPGLGNNQGSPSQGGQSKQNVRTPLLSQSNEERGGFGNDDDDSEA
jgi:hypothetical protein